MTVALEVRDCVAVLTLVDNARRNALSPAMVGELVATLERLERDDRVRALVVTGAKPAFCSGAALDGLAGAGRRELLAIYDAFVRVSRSPLPTVAAVNGPAVGAGLNLALACDVRVAAPEARFMAGFARNGLHPGGGHVWMLERAVGAQTAASMLLFDRELAGEDAVAAGLAVVCVPGHGLIAEACALAARAAAQPKPLAARVKQTLREVPALAAYDAAVEYELDAQVWSIEQGFRAELVGAERDGLGRGGD